MVEFWATWSIPCKKSIPHLTELARKYEEKEVRVIGVSVWEDYPAQVRPFVQEMGEKMVYSVAIDHVPTTRLRCKRPWPRRGCASPRNAAFRPRLSSPTARLPGSVFL